MINVDALNTALAGITIIVAVVAAMAIVAIALAWGGSRRHRAEHVATGVHALEEHLADAARHGASH